MKPYERIQHLVNERRDRTDAEILAELTALPPLPDEDDPAWDDEVIGGTTPLGTSPLATLLPRRRRARSSDDERQASMAYLQRAPGTRRRWRINWTVLAGLVVLGIVVFIITTYDPRKIGAWRSDEGRRAYEAAYHKALAAMPPPAQRYDIATSYGTVRVYRWETADNAAATPALFLPGRTTGTPMWFANLPAVAAHRPVYTVDTLGDAGLSEQRAPITDDADQAAWIDEVLVALGLTSAHLVGHSFGGWAAANYATRHPERVATLTLLEPVLTFQGLKAEVYLRSLPLALPLLPRAWRERFLQHMGGGGALNLNDPLTRMIASGAEHYAVRLPVPQRLSEEHLRGWAMPVFVAMAGISAMHDGAQGLAVAEANVANVRTRLWANATHSLPMEVAPELNGQIVDFLAAH
jgi:pimeloyl-ACP methyl ester carboxylesterase